MKYLPKPVWTLALCQVYFTAAISTDMTITSLAGHSLTSNAAMATLPFALLTVGGAIAMPILNRISRIYSLRYMMICGAAVGFIGAIISTLSVYAHNFWGLSVGCLCVGAFQASAQFYRLAAGDLVNDDKKQRAISVVLAGEG